MADNNEGVEVTRALDVQAEGSWSALVELGLPLSLVNAATSKSDKGQNWESPVPVQNSLLKVTLPKGQTNGRSAGVLVHALNGAGKTGAFLLASLSRITASGRGPQVVIIEPTNQLVLQVAEEAEKMVAPEHGGIAGIKVLAVQGKVKNKLSDDVIVGTAVQIKSAVSDGLLKCDNIVAFVVDECDEALVNSGPLLVEIRKKLPKPDSAGNGPLVLLVSATLQSLAELTPAGTRNETKNSAAVGCAGQLLGGFLAVPPANAPPSALSKDVPVHFFLPSDKKKMDSVGHFILSMNENAAYSENFQDTKAAYLAQLLIKLGSRKVLVFVENNKSVPEVMERVCAHYLKFTGGANPLSAAAAYKQAAAPGTDQRQLRAEETLKLRDRIKKLQKGEVKVLFCTGGLSRGIDILGLEVVVNFDFPERQGRADVASFQHRIGRVGRGKKIGISIVMTNGMSQATALKTTLPQLGLGESDFTRLDAGSGSEDSLPSLCEKAAELIAIMEKELEKATRYGTKANIPQGMVSTSAAVSSTPTPSSSNVAQRSDSSAAGVAAQILQQINESSSLKPNSLDVGTSSTSSLPYAQQQQQQYQEQPPYGYPHPSQGYPPAGSGHPFHTMGALSHALPPMTGGPGYGAPPGHGVPTPMSYGYPPGVMDPRFAAGGGGMMDPRMMDPRMMDPRMMQQFMMQQQPQQFQHHYQQQHQHQQHQQQPQFEGQMPHPHMYGQAIPPPNMLYQQQQQQQAPSQQQQPQSPQQTAYRLPLDWVPANVSFVGAQSAVKAFVHVPPYVTNEPPPMPAGYETQFVWRQGTNDTDNVFQWCLSLA
jgi:superfamily II DNA/RNA helicase